MYTPPNITIHFSEDAEFERVRNVYEKLCWYRKHGYNVRLPGERRLSECRKVPQLVTLLTELDTEFQPSIYEEATTQVSGGWRTIVRHWPTKEIEKTTLQFQSAYDIHLTRYGTGGSYVHPNSIVMSIRSGHSARFSTILFHEMIHLCIEPFVQKYNTPHWYKERIVDLIFKKLMPKIAFEQNLSKEALAVDTFFAQHYGNFDIIFSNIEMLDAK